MMCAVAEGSETGHKRSIVLRPADWSPRVAGAIVFVAVFIVVGFIALLLIGLLANDSETATPPGAKPVISAKLQAAVRCFETAGVVTETEGIDDFVAENASGGAIKALVQDNVATISDGLTPAGGLGIVHGYERLSSDLPLADILRRQGRFALLWGRAPTARQAGTVKRCLR